MSSSCVNSVCIKSVVGWQWSCGLWLSKISSVFRPTLLNNYLTWPSTIEHLNQLNQVSAGHNQWSLRKVRVAKSLQSFLNHFSNEYIVCKQMQQKILNPVKNRTSCFLWIVVGNHSVSSGLWEQSDMSQLITPGYLHFYMFLHCLILMSSPPYLRSAH